MPISGTLDASRYSSHVGQNVTFTARVSGNAGVPTGTIAFTDGTAVIAGCGAVAINGNGVAKCSTNRLTVGTHAIRGQYAGKGVYGSGVVGPIPETVS